MEIAIVRVVFNNDEEELSSMIQDSLTFQDFVNAGENVASTVLRNIETIYDDITAKEEHDDDGTNTLTAPSQKP